MSFKRGGQEWSNGIIMQEIKVLDMKRNKREKKKKKEKNPIKKIK